MLFFQNMNTSASIFQLLTFGSDKFKYFSTSYFFFMENFFFTNTLINHLPVFFYDYTS